MEEKRISAAPIAIGMLLLLLVLYVGSYLALVVPQGVGTQRMASGEYHFPTAQAARAYRISSLSWAYWPMEQIDRRVRPEVWGHGDNGRYFFKRMDH